MDFSQLFVPVGASLVSASIAFATAQYWYAKKKKDEETAKELAHAEVLKQRIIDLEVKVGLLGQVVTPISAAFQAVLIKQLTHFHTPEADALLAKLSPFTLTAQEEDRLNVLLAERAIELNGSIDESERDAAAMMPFVIRRVRRDVGVDLSVDDLKLVSVPAKAEAPVPAPDAGGITP